jgi:chaperonin cofactor prefoldin
MPDERIAKMEVKVELLAKKMEEFEKELKNLQWKIALFTGSLAVILTFLDKVVK